MKRLLAILLAVASLSNTSNAAGIDIVVSETSTEVILTGSGSIDLTGTSLFASNRNFTMISDRANSDFFSGLSQGPGDIYELPNFTSFMDLASTPFTLFPFGDVFGFQRDRAGLRPLLIVEAGYTSLDAINFTWVVTGTSIAALGLNFGVVGEFGANTITLSPAPIPLPASALFVLGGLSGLVLLRRRRSQPANDVRQTVSA